jgi:hypothetical protein
VLFVSALLGLSVTGCGAAGNAGGSSDSASSTATATRRTGIITTSVIPPGQRLRGDGDADNPGDIDANGDVDPGKDKDEDYPVPESYKFPDKDDKATFAYGHRPNATAMSAITNTVKRYYAAAATDNGAVACSLFPPSFASSIPEDYGQAPGMSYLRGAKTCQTVMSMFFQHFHEQLAEAITVVEVRVQGSTAQVVLSSKTMRASSIFLARQGSSWKVQNLLGQPLP